MGENNGFYRILLAYSEKEPKTKPKAGHCLRRSKNISMMGSLTSMFGSMFGEQSKAYKIMFAADKAYAIVLLVLRFSKILQQLQKLVFLLTYR